MVGKYLITTDAFFFAPDGKQYRAVWGEVLILPDSVLGVKTNEKSSNWYVRVGSEQEHVILAGCQIHYAVKVDQCPNLQDVQERVGTDNTLQTLDSRIYVPVRSEIPEPPKVDPPHLKSDRSDAQILTVYEGTLDPYTKLSDILNSIKTLMDYNHSETRSEFTRLLDMLGKTDTNNHLKPVTGISKVIYYKDSINFVGVDVLGESGGIRRSFKFLIKR